MPALGITVLKNNAPWGPFTREQINDGLARGDFTLRYLAHAPGMSEWHPLGEVLDYIERNAGPRSPALPPLPEAHDLPPIPAATAPKPSTPPILGDISAIPSVPLAIAPSPPPLPVLEEKKPEPKSEIILKPANFFPRAIAFLIDCAILFVPVGILFVICVLGIEIPAAWHHISHQARMDEWDLLELNTKRLLWIDALGFGWLYGAGMESSLGQSTIGKRWMGIKVTDSRGERLSFLRSTGRYAAKYLSALPCFLGFIMALFSSRNLTLHDRLSDTRVIKS